MDRWAWEQLDPWLEIRQQLPIGALLCVIHGPTAGRRWEASAARKQLHHAAAAAGVRRRFAPHQLRHAHAVEIPAELPYHTHIQHADLAITSVYLRGIDNTEIVHAVHERPAPMIPASGKVAAVPGRAMLKHQAAFRQRRCFLHHALSRC